jgi:MFS family permease
MLEETPVFEAMRERRELARGLPLRIVLGGHGRAVVISMLLTWLLTAAIVVVILMTPTLIQSIHAIPAADALAANSIATLALTFGCVVHGLLADRFGAARVLAVGCVLLLVSTWGLYVGLAHWPRQLPLLYGIAGFCVGVVGVIPLMLVQAFPPAVRFSGISFAYNVAYAIFGGMTPLLVKLLMERAPLAPAWYVGALCLLGVVVSRFNPVRPAQVLDCATTVRGATG